MILPAHSCGTSGQNVCNSLTVIHTINLTTIPWSRPPRLWYMTVGEEDIEHYNGIRDIGLN